MKGFFLFLFIFFYGSAQAEQIETISYNRTQVYTIKIHFLYGSKPKKEFKPAERKAFGGIHGGHVTIEVDGMEYGFNPTGIPVHIFPRKKMRSDFTETPVLERIDGVQKTTTFQLSLSYEQYILLKERIVSYCSEAPYDYAFFGMRCASSTREILEELGYFKNVKNFGSIRRAFYPKRLRKEMFKLAYEKGLVMSSTKGRDTRKWEKD